MLLSVLSVLCAGAAAGFGVAAHGLRSGASENQALVDGRATQAVVQQTSAAVRTAFSYNHADPAATREQAQQVLIGDAVQQYNGLFGEVERVAVEQGLQFATTVRSAGVTRLVDDRAELLLFVDQQGVRAESPERRSGSAQLGITAQRVGAEWKISRIEVL
ncbi:hypothetical protein IQ251_05030 [Saccharopolyspora sp. HNM0983]|uniref:Mce-associated membrane protein n=1 Tax=Saccharopolyspora montiporae TaxID=2781240 RepID=A0A929FYX8_9PSEU|nr:hypothetical protein [Saccharopolyspora sp. HNM0983]MBE9373809.1 hypothetical protein [Saccharopolyspora sp. HNM0983]